MYTTTVADGKYSGMNCHIKESLFSKYIIGVQSYSISILAFMFSMRAFAPVIGFMLGAWTTSLYVDLSGKLRQLEKYGHWFVAV